MDERSAPVEAPPALLAKVLREHGPDALADVEQLLASPEAGAHPRAALEALEAAADRRPDEIRKSLGALYRTLIALAIAGKLRRAAHKPDGGGAMARISRALDRVPMGDARAGQLREAAYHSGRILRARAEQLERASPEGQLAERVIAAAPSAPKLQHAPRSLAPSKSLDVARFCLPAGIEARLESRFQLVSGDERLTTTTRRHYTTAT